MSSEKCETCGAPVECSAPDGDLAYKDDGLSFLYHQLLYAVCSKHPGETRHETALRYIHERESKREGPAQERKA